ncbi:hypothetical protein BJX64DRAFT_283015 [Aspergillus heterothallicus]
MENNTQLYARAYSRREFRSRRFEQYLIDDLPLEQIMLTVKDAQSVSGSRETVDQWKWWFKREGIFKNLNKEESVYIRREIEKIASHPPKTAVASNCLVVAGNEFLLKNEDIDKSYARVKNPETVSDELPSRRPLIIIQTPSQLDALRQPEDFRNLQQLIFNTRVHFDSSFEANLWAPDERGVHARSRKLRKELEVLSDMHNQFVEAYRQFKSGQTRKGWAMVRSTFELSDQIVQLQHHRLFPDLLGILLVLQQRSCPDAPGLDGILRRHLCLFAKARLPKNDPRRQFFEFIMRAPLDSIHHLYLIFDRQCRQLWSSKVKGNEIESYYSYNQASFPRADRGRFYSLFEGRAIGDIYNMLDSGDRQFGPYSTEAICLWHTALQFFASNEQYEEMSSISMRLCVRLERFKERWDFSRPPQLNHDAAMSFYLHGHAEEGRGNTMDAIDAFYHCIRLRSQVVNREEYDPLTGIALRKLETISSRLGDGVGVAFYQGLLEVMYSKLEAKYMQDMADSQQGI